MDKNGIVNELKKLKEELASITRDEDQDLASRRLKRWEERAIKKIAEIISIKESLKFKQEIESSLREFDPYIDDAEEDMKYLKVLIEEVEKNPPKPTSSIQEAINKARAEEALSKIVDKSIANKNIYAVFLSHANADKGLANLLKSLLKDFGVKAFVAHDDIEEGEVWEPTIIEAVRSSRIMIVVGTKDIENSAWVNFETGLAYTNMFPFLLDRLSDKVSYIKNKQGIIVNYKNVEGSLLKLVRTVLSKLGLTTEKKDDEIKNLENFKKLELFIQRNMTKKKTDSPLGAGKHTAVWG